MPYAYRNPPGTTTSPAPLTHHAPVAMGVAEIVGVKGLDLLSERICARDMLGSEFLHCARPIYNNMWRNTARFMQKFDRILTRAGSLSRSYLALDTGVSVV